MDGQYLIPANSKRSMLIFSLFTKTDLVIVAVGGALSGLVALFVTAEDLKDIFTILSPLLITVFMVLPVPNHRNVWNLTANIYEFLSKRRTYYWKGWGMNYGEEGNE